MPTGPSQSQIRRREDGAVPDGVAAEEHIQVALDRIVLGTLRPIAMGLSLLYLLFAVAHRLVLPADVWQVMTPVAGLTALVYGSGYVILNRRELSPEMAHPVGGAMALLVLVNTLLQLHLTGENRQTTNLLLLILGVGILFLDPGWFAVVVVATFLGWIFIVQTGAPDGEWLYFGFALVGATLLSAAVLFLRKRTFERIERLHLQDRMRQLELESALARTETARRGEADARHALEEAVDRLKESEDRFRRLAEATFEGVVVVRDGVIRDANLRVAELFGYELDELQGRELALLVEEGDRGRVEDRVVARDSPGDAPMEATGLTRGGHRFPLEIGFTEASWQGERAVVTVLRDATRHKQAEEVLREAAEEAEASNRAKSTFLANMSHELRTPLNAVIGFSNILRKNKHGSFSDRDVEYLDRIVSNGKHLLALINDVLDLSKIEAGRMDVVLEEVQLDTLIREVHHSFELQASRKGIDLLVEVPPSPDPVQADGHRLRQILINLVGNAVKFTSEGHVALRLVVGRNGRVPLRIEVEDTGIGIPDHRLAEVFDPFQQVDASTSRKFGGTGLGLAISRSLCEIMRFRLSATSEEGRGSTFIVDLHPDAPPSAPVEVSATPGTSGAGDAGDTSPRNG
jgi:PAS domain S-box-containing protein